MTDQLFIGIRNPTRVRKDLLHSSKQLVNTLIQAESYKHIHQERQEHLAALAHILSELKQETQKIQDHLPLTELPPEPVAKKEVVKKIEKKKAPVKKHITKKKVSTPKKNTPPSRPRTKLDDLNDKLSLFEKELEGF